MSFQKDPNFSVERRSTFPAWFPVPSQTLLDYSNNPVSISMWNWLNVFQRHTAQLVYAFLTTFYQIQLAMKDVLYIEFKINKSFSGEYK